MTTAERAVQCQIIFLSTLIVVFCCESSQTCQLVDGRVVCAASRHSRNSVCSTSLCSWSCQHAQFPHVAVILTEIISTYLTVSFLCCVYLQWDMRPSTGLSTEDIWSSMCLNQSSLSFMVSFVRIVAPVCSRGSLHYFFIQCHKEEIYHQNSPSEPQCYDFNDPVASFSHSYWKPHNCYFSVEVKGNFFC